MKSNQSAGILLFRLHKKNLEVFLVHPGSPFWKNKDLGAWSIPKGEFSNEDPLEAAKREFKEETGMDISGEFTALAPVRQKGGKMVHAFAIEGEIDPGAIKSNHFQIAWPPGTGRMQSFPEVDKAGWFSIDEGKLKINSAQVMLLDELNERINGTQE